MADVSNITAGALIVFFSLLGLIGNTLLLVVSWCRKLYNRRIYFLIMSLAVSDGIVNLIQAVQEGFSIIFQKLTITGMGNRTLGWLFVHCFQLHVTKAIFILTIQALVVYRKDYGERFFTKRNVIVCVIFLWLFPLWQTTFLLPFYPLTDMALMSFVPESRNWIFNMSYPVAEPLNSASGAYLIFCFVLGCLSSFLILFKIWKARNEVMDVSAAENQKLEMKRLSFQFVLVIFLWLFQSILFYTLPRFCSDKPDVMFLLTLSNPFLFGSNFYIYFFANVTFRKACRETFIRQDTSTTNWISTFVHPASRRNNTNSNQQTKS